MSSFESADSVSTISPLVMPSLGADMEHGTLVVWNVKPGDVVKRGDIVAEVETEKGVFAMESTIAGTVKALLVSPGTKTKVGAPLAQLETKEAPPMAPPAAAARPPSVPPVSAAVPPVPGGAAPSAARRASPAARKLAAEHGIDVTTVAGTGPDGIVVLADVERAIAEQSAGAAAGAQPRADAAQSMRHAVAAAVSRSKREIPHYYLSNDVSLAKAMSWLAVENEKRPISERILPAALLLKSISTALRSYPDLNGVWTNGALQVRQGIHLGVAISLRHGGLISPAIHDADQLPLGALMLALNDLVTRTRSGGLRSSEITDATITVSSLGDAGVTGMFGVIYPPQVALVGLGAISERPWAEGGQVSARPVVTMTLSADHRATDGHYGSRFLREVDRLLKSPEAL